MSPRDAVAAALACGWTFVPIYATEKLADYFFLADNTSSFYFMSGWRLILFVAFSLVGSLAAGSLLRDVWKAAATQWTALATTMALFFFLCDQRVCFSTGPQGLEPLRLGLFLGSVAFSGATIGVALRQGARGSHLQAMGGLFGFVAIGFYPVIFTFAGAGLLPALFPLGILLALALAAFSISHWTARSVGPKAGTLIPLASLGALAVLSAGVSAVDLTSLLPLIGGMAAVTALASMVGSFLGTRPRTTPSPHAKWASLAIVASISIVMIGTVIVPPDAVNGVVPSSEGPGAHFVTGVPVYSGAYMDGPPGHAFGAGVTISFAGTDLYSIPGDDFLAAGMGVHSAGCCVDGIDYSYRFDAVLFRGGGEALVASAWEACDDNAACGGHPWKALMFSFSEPVTLPEPTAPLNLRMAWEAPYAGRGVLGSYAVPGGCSVNFTSVWAPAPENPSFNTGVLAGGSVGGQQKGSYFFQFGVMSRYPIESTGWRVTVSCPSLLTTTWSCVDHARTVAGADSFWKIFWRWGEDYPGGAGTRAGPEAAQFSYSGAETVSRAPLW